MEKATRRGQTFSERPYLGHGGGFLSFDYIQVLVPREHYKDAKSK
jgi:hypothetical protein